MYFDEKHYHHSGEPKSCRYCGWEESYEKVTGYECNTVSEFDVYCKNCDKIIGFWAYGNYSPEFAIYYHWTEELGFDL